MYRMSVRPSYPWLPWTPPVVWLAHGLGYTVWLLVDHDSAVGWMWRLGYGVQTHCFGEDGIRSHLPELECVAISTGFSLGALGLFAGVVALLRAEARVLRLIAVLSIEINLLLLAPGAVVFADALSRS